MYVTMQAVVSLEVALKILRTSVQKHSFNKRTTGPKQTQRRYTTFTTGMTYSEESTDKRRFDSFGLVRTLSRTPQGLDLPGTTLPDEVGVNEAKGSAVLDGQS